METAESEFLLIDPRVANNGIDHMGTSGPPAIVIDDNNRRAAACRKTSALPLERY